MGVTYKPLDFSKYNKRPISTFEPLFDYADIPTTTVVTATATEAPVISEPTVAVTESPSIVIATSPVTATPSVSASNKENFIATVTPIYEKVLKEHGYDPAFAKLLVAQDGLETGWKIDSSHYNLGNITAGNYWKGKTRVRGDRDASGKRTSQSFRVYDNLEQYVNDKVNLLASKRYKVFAGSADVDSFISRLKGYAVDPNYGTKIKRVVQSMQEGGSLLGRLLEQLHGNAKINDEIRFLDNWNKERSRLLEENSGIPGPLAATAHTLFMKTANKKIDPNLEYEGKYTSRDHTITLKDLDEDTIVHELAHASRPEGQVKKIAEIIKEMNGDIFADGVIPTAYNSDPNEIYAKRMAWVRKHNIDPSKPLTASQVYELTSAKKKNFVLTTRTSDKFGNYGFVTTILSPDNKVIYASPLQEGHTLIPGSTQFSSTPLEEDTEFDSLYSPEFILRVSNLVAENPVVKDADVLRAKLGLKLE